MIAVTADTECKQGGTDAIKESAREFGAQPHEGQAEKCGGQRVLLEWCVIRILPSQQMLGCTEGPTKIGSSLMEVREQNMAKHCARHSDKRGDADSQSQGEVRPHKL